MNFYHDQSRNLLIYDTVSPLVQQWIPDARQINGRHIALPRTLRNSQILRHLNFPVPPIMDGYDWPHHPSIKKVLPHQIVMANFSVLHPRMFNLSDMGCVDAETEYLSPTGWRRIDQYDGGQVAQYHLDGRAEFVQPSAYVVRPCDWMYRFKTTRGVDQKLSAEHRVLYTHYDGSLRLTTAKDVAEKQEAQIQGWRGRFITTFQGGREGIALPEAELRLMVAIIADGHFPYPKIDSCTISVKKNRKKIRLRILLKQAGILFKEKDLPWESKKGYARFAFKAPRHDKEFSAFYWNCSQQQLAIVADECQYWDGSAPVGKRGPRFYSTSKLSADFVQYAFTATGKTARVSQDFKNRLTPGIYVLNTRTAGVLVGLNGNRDDGTQTSPVTVEPTIDGKKYCFEVPTTFLILRRNGQIFITGNTMKTLSTLWAADWLMSQYPKGEFRALIVAPLSILQRVWGDAIFKHFLSRRSFEILHGSAERRLELLAKKADFSIINFDGVGIGAHTRKRFELDGFSKALAERDDIKLVIVDEASAYKDATTKRHRIARQVIGKRPYTWFLSGTPCPNAPTDAYGLSKLVNNAFGKSFSTFQQEVMLKLSQFKWIPQKDGYEKARQLLTPAIRYDLTQVWDGPEMTTQLREVALTPDQKTEMARLKRDLQVVVKSGAQISAINEASARTKLMQISLGAIYDEHHRVHLIDSAPRYTELKDIVDDAPAKLLILVPLTSIVHIVQAHLDKWNLAAKKAGNELRYSAEVVNGETSQKERNRIFSDFEEKEHPRILVADPGVLAHGLTLVAARTVVWFGITDKAELYAQANRRAHRPGQKWPVSIVQVVSNPLEREIFRRLENNLSLQGVMLDLVKENL